MSSNEPTNPIHPTILQYTSNINIAAKYDQYFKDSQLFRYDCEFLHANLSPPGLILDLGCGTARHMLFLESLGFDTYGIDLSRHFLKISKAKLKSFGLATQKLIQADIMHLPLNKYVKFDAVLLMFSVLGLIQGSENRASILSSLHPNLCKDSKVFMHVHNYEFHNRTLLRRYKRFKIGLKNPTLCEKGDNIITNYRNIQDIYIHSFTLDEIVNLFVSTGYTIKNLVGLNSYRDGPCPHKNIRKNANGFLICASPNP